MEDFSISDCKNGKHVYFENGYDCHCGEKKSVRCECECGHVHRKEVDKPLEERLHFQIMMLDARIKVLEPKKLEVAA